MFKVNFEYGNKKFKIQPFTTAQEKDILLLNNLDEENIDEALSIFGFEDDSLTDYEKKALLYKFREISVGEVMPVSYKCTECKHPNESHISVENNIIPGNITDERIKDAFKPFSEENIQDFLNIDIDDLDLDEYEELLKEVKNSVTKFDFIKEDKCLKCGSINYIDISNNVVDCMSEDSLQSMYQIYNDLNFFGSYTKQDIDSLYPFERTILIALLNKTREELNK